MFKGLLVFMFSAFSLSAVAAEGEFKAGYVDMQKAIIP